MALLDAPLDNRVLTALAKNPYLFGRTLRFETEQGRVTLRGEVRSFFQKQMARSRAAGGRRVRDLQRAGSCVVAASDPSVLTYTLHGQERAIPSFDEPHSFWVRSRVC